MPATASSFIATPTRHLTSAQPGQRKAKTNATTIAGTGNVPVSSAPLVIPTPTNNQPKDDCQQQQTVHPAPDRLQVPRPTPAATPAQSDLPLPEPNQHHTAAETPSGGGAADCPLDLAMDFSSSYLTPKLLLSAAPPNPALPSATTSPLAPRSAVSRLLVLTAQPADRAARDCNS
ncbi:hypothetical protein PTTG_10671 [Puccinia triticina 1-1 BBBD Race 1]|uniref:Uncharacterized protein n=1 Tax=Puccinia triticina (isolate 1-1 / race 1 (BBBD)) TaxID=630390 RepID=A0A0C4FBS2_PUCT1|nr:hypothetical protein PTTG_10671 [Puccinia triticina 1-1 BBBD Race 1]